MKAGDKVDPRTLTTIGGAEIAFPAPNETVHLQFRRFAGCPICSLHLREMARRSSEITEAGVTEIVVFHSAPDALRRYQSDLPFAVVADPDRKLYKEFGVESSIGAVLHPGAMRGAVRGLLRSRSLAGPLGIGEDHLGRPADFLIAPDGTVLARKYGVHADDQWSVDELLGLVAT
ncbi:peroxiredoxin-like family protein [Mycobacterium sp. 852002-51163_SCH5372311]|uniref:peroxiredoxin-like family protein n=1 Tax=Mycobacterium sp. 852002-51163_SCH5372311 TaxID=1834097 RepID=UPI0035145850